MKIVLWIVILVYAGDVFAETAYDVYNKYFVTDTH